LEDKEASMLIISGTSLSDFNAATRVVHGRVKIYFDGLNEDPVIASQDTYLVDFEVIEELSAETKNPFGAIAANESSFTLLNQNNIFTATNTSGLYYGKIKVGVPVIYEVCIEGKPWIPLGLHFVSDWKAKLGSITADVSCIDALHNFLTLAVPSMQLQTVVNYTQYFEYAFSAYNINVEINASLTNLLQYALPFGSSTPDFMQELLNASLCYLRINRYGEYVLDTYYRNTNVATFTDSDQIKDIELTQSIIKNYDGVSLTYGLPSLNSNVEVLSTSELNIPAGDYTTSNLKFSDIVASVSGITLHTDGVVPTIVGYTADNTSVNLSTSLVGTEAKSCSLTVLGSTITFLMNEITDNTSNMLKLENRYIQSKAYAEEYKELLNAFISTDVPEIILDTRGQPLIELGDTITVNSTKLNTVFIGLVKRQKFTYNGAFSSEVTLLNREALA